MNKQRQTYQQGCIQRKKRKRGSDVWILRYRENGMLKSFNIGTVLEFRTKAEAQRSLGDVRADINNNVEVVTFGQLCDRYLKEGVPDCVHRHNHEVQSEFDAQRDASSQCSNRENGDAERYRKKRKGTGCVPCSLIVPSPVSAELVNC